MARGTIRRPPEPAAAESPDLFPGDALPDAADPPDDFAAAHGESLADALDLDTWKEGPDFKGFYDRLCAEVAEAVRSESGFQAEYRRTVFPRLRFRDGTPPDAGVWRADPRRIEEVHRKVLFNGGVEACDGTVAALDTVPVTVTQVGVCLVSYRGNEGTWGHRLFRRDLRERAADPVEAALDVLERRHERDRERGDGAGPDRRDRLSEVARRGIMAYAERAALLDRSEAPWRMGHGVACPFELLTGSGMADLLRRSLSLMRRLVDYERFVFVQSETADSWLVTLGQALRPLEYAVVDDQTEKFAGIAGGGYRGEWGGAAKEEVDDFVRQYGPKVVRGLYRASRYAQAQIFYAHRDHAHEAALVAMADSVLQEHRGFPLLIDLADGICGATYGGGAFAAAARLAYAEAGEPFRYFGERQTRR
jgi:hypothetical protein